ncbi:membrane protein [Geoanaerobacter pelophilus]|uniref:Probable membrane transporter protein n=1 Tax=Geoanaerobacter pelophilus TaxID=60036 RepID=A0ABQ0MFX3_9BACT|nr:sulfite exporter TauE/SafE family protein [Geoanaerobacter pelophilus]GAW65996.1 membrane protein [Geoanaerobacter pelophilus]
MTFWLLYVALGAFAGVLAGLLGVGGGLVIVPVLTFIFTAQHMPDAHILHLALGTSLASIMFTSVSSLRAHHRRGAVEWTVVRRISAGILVGTFAGSWVASQLSTRFLKGFFVVFLYYVALQMLLNIKPKPHRQLPELAAMSGVGGVIGGVSSLVGIGGGTMTVPFLVWCNVAIQRAIGTSSAVGFPIALAGAAGYLVNGLSAELPQYSLGFVYLPALAGISATSMMTAPFGAKLAHTLPIDLLKKIFALLLVVMGTKMLLSLF